MKKIVAFSVILLFACGTEGENAGQNISLSDLGLSGDTIALGDSTGSSLGNDGQSMEDSSLDEMEREEIECIPNGVKPLPRAEMLGTYDSKRRRLVYFGGDNGVPVNCQIASHAVGLTDLWIYDTYCANFDSVPYLDGPPGRARGMAVYDSDRDQMVIFGGRYRKEVTGTYTVFNDAWALDLESLSWTELQTTGTAPVPRSNPAGAYNRLTQELLLFGGNSSDNGLVFIPHDDVWALNLETLAWRQVPTSSPRPVARLFHAAALDEEGDRLFIFGGGDQYAWQGPFLADIWVLDLATSQWTQLHDGSGDAPVGRIWSTIAYDNINNRVLLFGGHDDYIVGNTNDTWAFNLDSNTWEMLLEPDAMNKPANGFCDFPPDFTTPNGEVPERRQGHLAALDPIRGEWIVHGGKTDCGIIDDVWTFDLARDEWIRLFQANQGETCIRGDNPEMCIALCK